MHLKQVQKAFSTYLFLYKYICKLYVTLQCVCVFKKKNRWTQMNEEIGDQFKKAQTSLSLLESYVGLHAEMTAELDQHEEQCSALLVANTPASRTMDFFKLKLQDVQVG